MKDFEKLCRRTLSTNFEVELHCCTGIFTEGGELADAYKKHIWYGRDLDIKNVKEEIGDLLWYLGVLCTEIDYSIEQAQQDVILKLKKRYPNKFEDILKRDVGSELSHIG